jgi:shikimate dehydrogenase
MLPSRGTPVPDALLHADLWVADAVYSPLWTPLLLAAKAKGAAVMTGRELAIYQAADAFELFTGLMPSTSEMGNAFDDVMAKEYPASHAA